ncbi:MULTISPECIES: DNA topology modulation protein FlaR [Virgibacillus]|uniref:DNA topology modulation protein FlaR n=1 Tax=Virgibacillus dokdonensis TaxID=302167 RepID=A0ABU7VCP9_9BACI|nr:MULTISPECIES: DNA topology modulation protein FlaR [Virgibacillus]
MKKEFLNRIHIIGSVGSGKTTLAKALSASLHIPYYELDNVVRKRSDSGDIKRTVSERDTYLKRVIHLDRWIIEGVHHTWVSPCFQHADLILFLDTNYSVRRFRIIKRFILQKLGREKANYKPSINILKALLKYNKVFEEKSKDEIFAMLAPYKRKLIILHDTKNIQRSFNEFFHLPNSNEHEANNKHKAT